MDRVLHTISRTALLATALTPLIMSNGVLFSYTLPKLVFFRSMVLIAAAAFLGAALLRIISETPLQWNVARRLRDPFIVALLVFMVLLALSAGFADNGYRAFWGNIERGEGVFGMLHYFVFFLLTLAVFSKEDWRKFLKLFLISGAILIVVAVSQYLRSPVRPISLVGNPAFLATHLLFLIMAAGVVGQLEKNRLWRVFALVIALSAAATIFLTGTRGAMLGLFAGVACALLLMLFSRKEKMVRVLAAALLGAGVLLASLFIVTRHHPVWQRLPGFDRLARTAFFDPADPSTQTRLTTWRTSSAAFRERPLLGWGPDNYVLAFEQHYDPSLARYGESWLDRAHNKVFDLLVMYGALGTAAYLAMVAALLAMVWRSGVPYRIVFVGGYTAYLVQDLFIMDQLLSHLGFFAFAAFAVSEKSAYGAAIKERVLGGALGVPIMGAAMLGIGLSLYGLYAWNYVPYAQAKAFRSAPLAPTIPDAVARLERAMRPYTFAQFELRANAFDAAYLEGFVRESSARAFRGHEALDEALLAMLREAREREPYDVRTALREAQLLDAMAADDPRYYEEIGSLLEEAIRQAPKRQELYYQLALARMKQDQHDEAIAAATEAVRLAPEVARAHFHLGVVLAAAGKRPEAEAALGEVARLDPSLSHLLGGDHNLLLAIYTSWGETEKVATFVLQSLEGNVAQSFELRHVRTAMGYFILREDASGVIAIAEHLRKDAQFGEDMELIIQLAEEGSWNVLKTL